MVRRLRLVSGLLLFVFVLTHFLNHGLGLVSLDALEAGRVWFLAFWRSPPATLLLYGALLLHMALAVRRLYRRRRLAMPAWEAAQLLTGLAIPPLLILHVLGTRFAAEVLGAEGSYLYILLIYFELNPASGLRQLAVMIVTWVHGCVGVHFWAALPAVVPGLAAFPVRRRAAEPGDRSAGHAGRRARRLAPSRRPRMARGRNDPHQSA